MIVIANVEAPSSRPSTATAALLLIGGVVGLVSAAAGFAFAEMLPGSLSYDGPATDIPVFSELDTEPLRRTVLAGAVITLVTALAALTGLVSLRRGAAPHLGVWLLAAFGVLTGFGGYATALLFAGGDDKAEVIRSGLPTWFVGSAVVLWFIHAATCIIAAALLTSRSKLGTVG